MENLVRLTVVPNQSEANIVCSLLRVNGIDTEERPTDASVGALGGPFEGGWREILVREADLDAAQELLDGAPESIE